MAKQSWKSATPEGRFAAKFQRGEPDACWLWRGGRRGDGYGSFWDGQRQVGAHRFAWRATHGGYSDSCVLHTCDTPLCVNPNHLFEGTIADNNLDRARKGRDPGWRRVNQEAVAAIFCLRKSGLSQREIGDKLGIGQSTVHRYLNGRVKWQHDA